ncbi:MAG: alpha-amylase family glycosyl hydrolase [Ignavibacteriaceae bacterium]
MKLKIFLFFFVLLRFAVAQEFSIERIEPPNWWAGMKYDTVQVMIYGKNISDAEIYPSHIGAQIIGVHKAESPNYLFIDLTINKQLDSTVNYEIGFSKKGYDTVITFPIYQKEVRKLAFQGFNQSDIVYLIMADRFCDGDTSNNSLNNKLEEFTSKDLDGRKGGDIAGIISKLDYLKELGITSLWITPMLENNMWMSYHGYAATDLYKIDPRFGSNRLFKELVDRAHYRGLKIIMDHVSNHIGINHWWIKDIPFKDWINGTPENHLHANHNKMTFPDPHSPGESVALTWDGWFENYMPDLNQRSPYLKKYLIQNTLWWIEYLGIDGVREDTYPYVNQYFLSDWAKTILDEYPSLNIVGEIWTGESAFLAAYQHNNKFGLKLNSNLPCVTDFALSDAVRDFLSSKNGLEGIFNVIAMDYLFYEPENLLTFIDNHDIARGLYLAKGDVDKFKVALTILFTTRGIPQILYGTEIGIVGDEKHGNIRSPFPGGFNGDTHDAFYSCDRTEYENDIYNFIQQLIELRTEYKSLSQGTLYHYYPFNNVYTYFRELNDESTMIVVNGNDEDVKVDLSAYKESLNNTKSLINLKTKEAYNFSDSCSILIHSMSAQIFLLKK